MSNKKLGSDFEREFAQILDSHGFWVHLMAQNAAGQPFDVLAARNGKTYPIDCKVCVNDYFRLDRVEDNQRLSMWKWRERRNKHGWFALKLSNGDIWMVADKTIEQFASDGLHTLTSKMIETYGFVLEEWVEIY